jgi:hypothetical protein
MSVELVELEASFLRVDAHGAICLEGIELPQAQGMMFSCPKCFEQRDHDEGIHRILCWFGPRRVDKGLYGVWTPRGTSLEDLTLEPGFFLNGPMSCGWHGFIRNGTIVS